MRVKKETLTHMNMRNHLNAIDALEKVLSLISTKLDENEYALSELFHKHENGELYSNEDAGMMDYHEGAVEALSIIKHQAEELFKLVN